MAEILLYDSIDRYSAERFVKELEKTMGQDAVVRVFSGGGNPQAGYTMLAKMKEHGNIKLKVDGYAHSTAAFMLCYAKGVECLDVSEFTLHRAAYPTWMEPTQDQLKSLNRINQFLREGLEAKIDVSKFEEMTGVTMDELFSNDARIDVTLSASDAKEIGLVDEVREVTSETITATHQRMEMAASTHRLEYENHMAKIAASTTKEIQTENPEKMTIQELNAKHPDLVAQIKNEAIENEKDRVEAWLVFQDVDASAVKEGIESGKAMSAKQQAEMTRKMASSGMLKDLEKENPKAEETETEQPGDNTMTEAEKVVADFEAQVMAELNLTTEKSEK